MKPQSKKIEKQKIENEVEKSNEFGRKEFEPIRVRRESSDYGWNGENTTDDVFELKKIHREVP